MAEVDVKKSDQQRNQSLERSRHSGGLERRGPFSLNPSEFFSMSPFSLMRRFTEDMDRIFEDFGAWRGRRSDAEHWAPAVEVREREGRLEVLAELPGVNDADVKVEVNKDGLVIQGERKREHEEKREGYYHSERSYGHFYRLIPIPEGANIDQSHAEFHNGELRVSIPVPEQGARQIPISTTGERKEPQSQTSATSSGARRAG
jgi:HSP20 family protein